jgi:hypothetical protein
MVEYSYSIYVDEQQLQALDDKIKRLEELSGEEGPMPLEGLTDRISEILEMTGINRGDDTTETLEEIRNNVIAVRNMTKTILYRVESLEIDEDYLAELFIRLARDNFVGDVMGTRQPLEANDRLDRVFDGDLTVDENYTSEDFIADLDKASFSLQGSPIGSLGIDPKETKVFVNETQFQEITKLARDASVAKKQIGELIPDMEVVALALDENQELLRDLREGGPISTALNFGVSPGEMEKAGGNFWVYNAGKSGANIDEAAPTMMGIEAIKDLDDWISVLEMVVDNYETQYNDFSNRLTENQTIIDRVGFTGGGGSHMSFRAILNSIKSDIMEQLETQLEEAGGEFDPATREKFVTNISKAVDEILELPEGKYYDLESVKRFGKIAEIMDWSSTKDIIEALLDFIRGISKLSETQQSIISATAGTVTEEFLSRAPSEIKRQVRPTPDEQELMEAFRKKGKGKELVSLVKDPEAAEVLKPSTMEEVGEKIKSGRIKDVDIEESFFGGMLPKLSNLVAQLKDALRSHDQMQQEMFSKEEQKALMQRIIELLEAQGVDTSDLPLHGSLGGSK